MTDFVFTELVDVERLEVKSTALGTTGAGNTFAQADLGKPVKLSTANNYVLCATTNEIEGFVHSVSPETVNSGYSFGGIQTSGRKVCKVGSNQTGTLAVGELAVADTPSALGTADAYPLVREGTPSNFKWRCIRIVSGTGAAGDLVLLEKV